MQNITTAETLSGPFSVGDSPAHHPSHVGVRLPIRPLPTALGIAADLGLVLSLILVLLGWGVIGTIAGVAVGIGSLSGVITFAVLQLGERDRGRQLPAARPAYALVAEDPWQDERAA
jgi:hypothetical protein